MHVKHKLSAALAMVAASAVVSTATAADPYKVGLMLPSTGTFAALGTAIENGFKLYVNEQPIPI